MKIDYDKLNQEVNEFARNILLEFQNDYSSSFSDEQKELLIQLLNKNVIVIESEPNEEVNNLFNNDVPSAHGGRTRNDGLIHIYTYSDAFRNCNSYEEIFNMIKDNLIVHELFHYFIRPDFKEKEYEEYSSFITEGLVELYAKDFSSKHGLNIPQSDYDRNVDVASSMISNLDDRDKVVFNEDGESLLNKIYQNSGINYMNEYDKMIKSDREFYKIISMLIGEMNLQDVGSLEDVKKRVKHRYKKIYNPLERVIDVHRVLDKIFGNIEDKKSSYISMIESVYPNEMREFIDMKGNEEGNRLK